MEDCPCCCWFWKTSAVFEDLGVERLHERLDVLVDHLRSDLADGAEDVDGREEVVVGERLGDERMHRLEELHRRRFLELVDLHRRQLRQGAASTSRWNSGVTLSLSSPSL